MSAGDTIQLTHLSRITNQILKKNPSSLKKQQREYRLHLCLKAGLIVTLNQFFFCLPGKLPPPSALPATLPHPWGPRTNHSPATKGLSWPSRGPSLREHHLIQGPYKSYSSLNITPVYKILPLSQLWPLTIQQPAPMRSLKLAVKPLLTLSF